MEIMRKVMSTLLDGFTFIVGCIFSLIIGGSLIGITHGWFGWNVAFVAWGLMLVWALWNDRKEKIMYYEKRIDEIIEAYKERENKFIEEYNEIHAEVMKYRNSMGINKQKQDEYTQGEWNYNQWKDDVSKERRTNTRRAD